MGLREETHGDRIPRPGKEQTGLYTGAEMTEQHTHKSRVRDTHADTETDVQTVRLFSNLT